jgi:Domain of unknown function (DUF4184)
MPFTLSHAAAVLPLRRTRLVWSALVIGSFGPDFQYFFLMSYSSRSWHHYPDVLRYCFPFTVAAFVLFELFVKGPVTGLLPLELQRRIDATNSALPRSFGEVLIVLCSLLLGIGTHVAWDSFTHPHTWPWRHITFLHKLFRPSFGPPAYGYEYAQEMSTIIGLAIVLGWFGLWYRRKPATQAPASRVSTRAKVVIWAEIVVLTCAGALWRATMLSGPPWVKGGQSYFQIITLISGIGFLLWQLLAYGVAFTWAHHREQKYRGAHR